MSHLLPVYARINLEFERGEGCWLYTESGDRYLDFMAGIGVNALGHAHPVVIDALMRQSRKLWHVSNVFSAPWQKALAARFCDATFADLVFFANSGAEAVECALKMARKYFSSQGMSERYRVIGFKGAFHGRTFATLAAAGRMKYLEGFEPPMPGFDHVSYGDIGAVEAAICAETAAILIEPIQGEGGVHVAPPGFLKSLRNLADRNGLLLIFDEVQCGMGRTGKLFAHEWDGVRPDIMAVAKGIGGGFPLAACLATAAAAFGMTQGAHGSTYGGNPLAVAVGTAVLDTINTPAFLAQIQAAGLYMKQSLVGIAQDYPEMIEEVRGLGLMLGLKCRKLSADVLTAIREQKLLGVLSSDEVIRFLPPLIVSNEEIDEAISRIRRACESLTVGKSGFVTS